MDICPTKIKVTFDNKLWLLFEGIISEMEDIKQVLNRW